MFLMHHKTLKKIYVIFYKNLHIHETNLKLKFFQTNSKSFITYGFHT